MTFSNVKAKKLGLQNVPSNAEFTVATAATSVNTVIQLRDFQLETVSNRSILKCYLTDGDSSTLTDTGTLALWSDVTTFKVVSTTGSQLLPGFTAGNTYLPILTCSNGTITIQIGQGAEDYFFLHLVTPKGQTLTSPIITTSA